MSWLRRAIHGELERRDEKRERKENANIEEISKEERGTTGTKGKTRR